MASDLGEDAKEEFQQVFNLYDRNHDGNVNVNELGYIMRYLGHILSTPELNDIIKDFGSGTQISLDGFLKFMGTKFKEVESAEEVIQAFRVFDKDGKGLIGATELRHLMCNQGEKLDDALVESMINEAIPGGDGQLNYENFVRDMLSRNV